MKYQGAKAHLLWQGSMCDRSKGVKMVRMTSKHRIEGNCRQETYAAAYDDSENECLEQRGELWCGKTS